LRLRNFGLLAVAILSLGFLLAACGGSTPEGDCLVPDSGKLVPGPCSDEGTSAPTLSPPLVDDTATLDLSGGQVNFVRSCGTCHTIDSLTSGQVGPNLTHVAGKGAAYLEESIRDPNAIITDACPNGPCAGGIMPANFDAVFSDEQIQDIVDFLLLQQ